MLKTSTLKREEGKKRGRERKGKREKGASEGEGEKREVPVVAAVVLVCLPADKPQGSHGTFEARTRAGGWRREDKEGGGQKGERDRKRRKKGRKRKKRI